MTFRLLHISLIAAAVLTAEASIAPAHASRLPNRMISEFGCDQIQEVTISPVQQAAALRFWTLRRADVTGPPSRTALAKLARTAFSRPNSLTVSACGTSGQSAPARPAPAGNQSFQGYPSVGRLFFKGDGVLSESCTASVIDNNGKQQPKGGTMLLLTAAHCIEGTILRTPYFSTDFAFVPEWRKGKEPFGTWTIQKYYIYKKWLECPVPVADCHTDPAFDFAIMVVAPRKGIHIGAVTGANGWLEPVPGKVTNIHVVGYPASSAVPLLSLTDTTTVTENGIQYRTGRTPGFSDGTSGGPWFKSTGTGGAGTIIGDTGGFQQGGDQPTPSYSDIWDSTFAKLVAQARKDEEPPASGIRQKTGRGPLARW